MDRRLFGILLLSISLSACGSGFDVYSPSEIHRTVQKHPNHEGLYLVHYRQHQVINKYGPGVDNVREGIRKNPDNWRALWDRAAAEAVTRYMTEKGLIPKECVNGIVIVSSDSDEAGGGTTAFRCK